MSDGFKTLAGAVAITGLMGLPLWLWSCRSAHEQHILLWVSWCAHPSIWASVESQRFLIFRYMPGSVYASPVLGGILIIGRLICASVEVWVLLAHIIGLVQQDEATRDAA